VAEKTRKATRSRRRVRKDPAPPAFAARAEAHREAGEFDDAIRVCRAGLLQHPDHLPARVTLGRALLALGHYEEAQAELDAIAAASPDQLTPADAGSTTDGGPDGTTPAGDPFTRALEMLDALSRGGDATGRAVARGDEQRALRELEAWLAAILRDRAARRATGLTGA
jgi:tetratricopeptide (TPR) repeat protein